MKYRVGDYVRIKNTTQVGIIIAVKKGSLPCYTIQNLKSNLCTEYYNGFVGISKSDVAWYLIN